ncbi:hypothetical protein [Nocardia farcinica]|nr:hypothetical protein [Nocardia farcinica]
MRDADNETAPVRHVASPLGDDAPADAFRLQGEIDRVMSQYRATHPEDTTR